MANKTSQHILGTSANLLGFCLFIMTSLHFLKQSERTLVDEFTSIIALLLLLSSLLSFLSIRTQNEKREYRLEKAADYFFMAALIGILGIILFIAISFWNK
jgi:hypothetical protein